MLATLNWKLFKVQIDYLSDKFVQRFPHFLHSDQFTELMRIQIVQVVKWKILLVNRTQNLLRNSFKLMQWRQRLPLTRIDHFAKAKNFLKNKHKFSSAVELNKNWINNNQRKGGPSTPGNNFKDRSKQPSCRLWNVDHVTL